MKQGEILFYSIQNKMSFIVYTKHIKALRVRIYRLRTIVRINRKNGYSRKTSTTIAILYSINTHTLLVNPYSVHIFPEELVTFSSITARIA